MIIGILFPSRFILFDQFIIVSASKQNWLTIKNLALEVSENLFFKNSAFLIYISGI